MTLRRRRGTLLLSLITHPRFPTSLTREKLVSNKRRIEYILSFFGFYGLYAYSSGSLFIGLLALPVSVQLILFQENFKKCSPLKYFFVSAYSVGTAFTILIYLMSRHNVMSGSYISALSGSTREWFSLFLGIMCGIFIAFVIALARKRFRAKC